MQIIWRRTTRDTILHAVIFHAAHVWTRTMNWSVSRPLRIIARHGPAISSNTSFCRRGLVSAADVKFGQPLHETHPHLIKAGELTPGISALEYHHRRADLARRLPRNSIAVLAAHDLKYRSGAVFYDYHQDSNFYYLTGKLANTTLCTSS